MEADLRDLGAMTFPDQASCSPTANGDFDALGLASRSTQIPGMIILPPPTCYLRSKTGSRADRSVKAGQGQHCSTDSGYTQTFSRPFSTSRQERFWTVMTDSFAEASSHRARQEPTPVAPFSLRRGKQQDRPAPSTRLTRRRQSWRRICRTSLRGRTAIRISAIMRPANAPPSS